MTGRSPLKWPCLPAAAIGRPGWPPALRQLSRYNTERSEEHQLSASYDSYTQEFMENHKIAKAASIVGLSTLLSRIAGLVRDQVTAYFFGSSYVADAFFVAFRIPNLLRRLLGEGALTVAFVPVFTKTMEDGGRDSAGRLFRSTLTLLAMTLLVICALGVIFAPQVVTLIAPGFKRDPELFSTTVFLARILFPYIFFMGIGALFMGALNSSGRFAAPALGAFVGNISMIAGAIILSPRLEMPILGLAAGAMAGGALQLAIQLPSLRRAGLSLRPGFDFRCPGIKKILLLMGPAAFGAAVYQISVFINTILGSTLPEGSISWLYYADRLMQFPLGIFTMAISTAALPALARQSARGDTEGFISSARFALGLSFFITVPAMAGLITLAHPLISALFQRGQFNQASVDGTALALRAFAVGLPFLSGAGILARIFYSRANTKTPTMVAAGSLVIGTISAWILMGKFDHVGLAMGSAISSLTNFFWLYTLLLKSDKGFPGWAMAAEVFSYFLMAAVMGAAVWPLAAWADASAAFWPLAVKTLLAVSSGVGIYIILSVITRRPHVAPVTAIIRRKLKR
ncbi:murein biosynthesis integral membrane protein MurJ [Deltaproteobacteria bacterium Smac51]|nr:murein biosynthesis integral membrane protein MurJ [Deltaproteobacteria bacterium Smac51]